MKKLTLLLALFIATGIGLAQNTNLQDVVPKEDLVSSPDVMAFHKYNSLPVNLYTGKVNINLPLYEVKTGDIRVPISLSYNTGGIKVDDIASNVGLGWNLNASGSIIKVTKDIDDHEFQTGVISENDFDYGSESCRYVTRKGYFKDYPDINSTTYPEGYCQDYDNWGEEDASPDIFIANAPGLSSRFILDKNANTTYDILPIDNSGIINANSINYENVGIPPLGFSFGEMGYGNSSLANANPWAGLNLNGNHHPFFGYNSFELLNTNGLKYTFDEIDLRESLVRKKGFFAPIVVEGQEASNITTAHHLSNITDTKNQIEVNFNYEEYQKPTLQFERSVIDDALTGNVHSNYYQNRVFGFIPKFNRWYNNDINDYEESFFKTSVIFVKYTRVHRLNEITFDGGKVQFIYNHIRLDQPDEKALTEIIIRDYNDQIVNKYAFDYDYFISKENCNEFRCKRLKLLRVRKIGRDNSSIDLYNFDYEYSNPLPKVNSLQQDFLGYYNNNGTSTPNFNPQDFSTKRPTLYYHPNKGRNSILPFPLQGESHTVIQGNYSLQPNSTFSKSGILKTIEYSTGGKSEFEYESHQFNFLGNQYLAGGTRIKRQKLTDDNNNIRIFNYEYLDNNGNSTGYINNIPVFGQPFMWYPITPTNNVSFVVFDKPRTALELTDGSFIGYSQVIEKEIGNGQTIHQFTSPETNPNIPENYEYGTGIGTYNPNTADQQAIDFFKNNSSYPTSHYIDNDILRGKLISQEIKNENNELLKKVDFEYSKTVFNTINLNYRDALDNYKTDNQNGTIGLWRLHHSSQLNIERNLQTKKTTTEHFDGSQKITEEFFEYNGNYPFLTKYRFVDSVNEISTESFYPFDPQVGYQPYITSLVNQNRISEPIMEITKSDGNTLTTSRKNYHNYDGLVFPKSISIAKGNNTLEEENKINLRDTKGNILQYTNKSNVSHCIIWNYHNTQPIARIVNATYAQIEALSQFGTGFTINQGLTSSQESQLRTQLPNAMVTTYTYDSLIGVTSMTDPKGYTVFYEYDEFNRLKFIKDQEGHLLSENEYNYANQN